MAGQFQLEPWEIKEKRRAAILAACAILSICKQLAVTFSAVCLKLNRTITAVKSVRH